MFEPGPGEMNMLWMLVAVRVLVNPLSNVLQKLLARRSVSAIEIIGYTHGLLTLVCLPALLFDPPPTTRLFWSSMAACAVLGVAGNVLIVKALEVGDLSIVGPINSFKPVVSMIPGLLLLREIPTAVQLAGVGLVFAGSCIIAGDTTGLVARSSLWRLFSDRGVQYRLAALTLSATEAVFIKQALLASSPVPTFAVWSVMGFVMLLPWLARYAPNWRDPTAISREKTPARSILSNFLLLALTTGLMQLCTIAILCDFQVAAALALFQTSTLVSVLLGWLVFHEPNVHGRLLGAVVMAAGAVLIITNR